MNCLVTGGSGFIGSNLVNELIKLGHSIVITGRNDEQNVNCPCVSYDFHNINWNFPVDIVFHKAAITDTTHKPEEDFYLVNFEQSKKLFCDAFSYGCKKFVYASSCAVYGNINKPFKESNANSSLLLNSYGLSKILFDEWVIPWAAKNNVKVIGLRYSNVYGKREEHKGKSSSMIYQLMLQMKSGYAKLFKWGEQKRDFVYINDVINANILAMNLEVSGIFNVGSGIATSFNKIVDVLNDVMNVNLNPQYFDNPYEGNYQNFTQCDLTKSNEILKFYPQINIEDGIKMYYDYFKE